MFPKITLRSLHQRLWRRTRQRPHMHTYTIILGRTNLLKITITINYFKFWIRFFFLHSGSFAFASSLSCAWTEYCSNLFCRKEAKNHIQQKQQMYTFYPFRDTETIKTWRNITRNTFHTEMSRLSQNKCG